MSSPFHPRAHVAACLFAALAVVCASAPVVRAQSAPAAVLVWRVPPGADCASAGEIRERVGRLTSVALLDASGAAGRPEIRAELSEEGGRWIARLSLSEASGGAPGTRELAGKTPDCRSLDVTLAIVIATMLDGLPVPPPAPRAAPAADGGKRVGVGGGLSAGFGLVPSPVVGLGVSLELPRWLAIDASAYLPDEVLDRNERGARLWVWHAGASVCPRLFEGTVEVRLCAGGQLGAIHASSLELEPASTAVRLLALAGLEPRLGLRLGPRFQARTSVLAAWVPVRPRFVMDLEGERRVVEGGRFVLLLRIGIIGFFL